MNGTSIDQRPGEENKKSRIISIQVESPYLGQKCHCNCLVRERHFLSLFVLWVCYILLAVGNMKFDNNGTFDNKDYKAISSGH